MGTHTIHVYTERGGETLIDVLYCDSYSCMEDVLDESFNLKILPAAGECDMANGNGSLSWGPHPGGDETDSDVYCEWCHSLMWYGLQHGITCHVGEEGTMGDV